jgi:hypothetical protein
MLLTIGEFRHRVETEIGNLVIDLQELTGRTTEEEEKAWRSSLPKVAHAFASPSFEPLHLYFGSQGNLGLEYQLPASSSWCDLVLLGRHDGRPSAVIVELKDWQTRTDKPGPVEGIIEHVGGSRLHPSDQVRGYTEYCRRFHSAVHDYGARVAGCVIFTRDYFINSYLLPPNDGLVADYPCFTLNPQDVKKRLPGFFANRLTVPDREFAEAFDKGVYRQDRGFVRQIGEQILRANDSPFELLDNQRRAFALVRAQVESSLFEKSGDLTKQVILIDGPPGSGKSVLAAKLWSALVADERLPDGDVVLTTTSASQSSNWEYLFQQAAHDVAARGLVKRATSYAPVTTQMVGKLRDRYGPEFVGDAGAWEANVKILRSIGVPFRDGAQDDQYLVSIVDEAHALINPEAPEGRGQYGFAPTLGPQAYHIIRSSVVSIFLLDAQQSFRDRENTSADDIKKWAKALGAQVKADVSLAGTQFRCAGSKEYVDWVEAVLRGDPSEKARELARAWRLRLELELVDTPFELERILRGKLDSGSRNTVRLLASYARKWKTKGKAAPHDLPAEMQDFYEPVTAAGQTRYWRRVWNYVPDGSDYTHFIQARPGSRMHDDPLCEVGCPYAVRGFDFDYVGLLWLGDLLWRDGRWTVDADQVFETGIDRTRNEAARETDEQGAAHRRLLGALAQGYRILLTRPMKGIFLWVDDQETRQRIAECLG